MLRTLLAMVLLTALGLSTALHAQTLGDAAAEAARRSAAARAKEAGKPADPAKPAEPAKPAAPGTPADPAKTTKPGDAKPAKVYTNRDLRSADAPSPAPKVAAPVAEGEAAPNEPSTLDAMRVTARQQFSSQLGQLSGMASGYSYHVSNVASTCGAASYFGLSPAARKAHLSSCSTQQSDLESEKAGIEAYAGAMQATANARGIYPGVMRELFVKAGWDR